MDEELEITVTASKTKFNLITKDEYDIKVISFDSREIVINCIKELIKFCEISQEELYPWIACSDRMPDPIDYDEIDGRNRILTMHKKGDWLGFPTFAWRITNIDGAIVWIECDLKNEIHPTHWHPIPTL